MEETNPKIPEEQKKEVAEPKPLSMLEETKAVVAELKKEKEEISQIKNEIQQLRSEQILSGTAGGHVPVKQVTEDEKKQSQAEEFFKDTALGDAIKKTK